MGIEIERKFLLLNDSWRASADAGQRMRQGYMASEKTSSIRIRVSDDKAWLNIKSATLGIRRSEYEYSIPLPDANEMLDNLCRKPLIEKTRYKVQYGDHLWEIDVFAGDNEGLIVAEIELASEDETFDKPPWIGEDVSGEPRYYNVCLVENPYRTWSRNSGNRDRLC